MPAVLALLVGTVRGDEADHSNSHLLPLGGNARHNFWSGQGGFGSQLIAVTWGVLATKPIRVFLRGNRRREQGCNDV